MAYRLVRSNRKTIAMQINRELEIIVRAPLRMSQRDIGRFVYDHEDWINKNLEKQRVQNEKYPPLSPAELKVLKEKAQAYLPARLHFYAQKLQLYPTSVKVTKAKTRLGSCSAKNGICLSCVLMRYDPYGIDYVIVHELAHILYKNHGPQFYQYIEKVMPDYKERIKMLK